MKTPLSVPGPKKPLVISLLIFSLFIILTQFIANQAYAKLKNYELQKAVHEANIIKDRLRSSLSYSLSATKTLAFIVEKYGIGNKFNEIAEEIISSNKFIDALELTNKGVITEIYPKEGNIGAIGYNILSDSLRNIEAYKTIKRKEIFFAGPFELKQGGLAVVGRLPIFIDNDFQGFSAVIIKLPTLLKAAGIEPQNKQSEFIYQLSKVNPNTYKEEFFLPDLNSFDKEHSISVEIPFGGWKLYVKKKKKEVFYSQVVVISMLGFLLSIISGLFAWYLTNQPEKLKRLVEEKTNALMIVNKDLAIQNQENEKRSTELIMAYNELKKAEEYQMEYILALKEIMFMTSHKMRQPIAHILGITMLLETSAINSHKDLLQLTEFLKDSVVSLDQYTRELTLFIHKLELKEKNKKQE